MLRGDSRPLVELHHLVGLLFAEAHDRRDVSSVDVFAPASGKVLGDLVECHFRTKERGQFNPSASHQQITKRKVLPAITIAGAKCFLFLEKYTFMFAVVLKNNFSLFTRDRRGSWRSLRAPQESASLSTASFS